MSDGVDLPAESTEATMTFMRRARRVASFSIGLFALWAGSAQAQSPLAAYPSRPVRIIVPFVAGGPTDAQARWAAERLTTALGQTFIVENRASAGGTPATLFVVRSAPDGYTLLAANPGPLTIGPQLRNTGYTLKDLTPIILIAKTPSCVAVRSSLPVEDFRGLVALAKARPRKIGFGSPGIGTVGHLTGELIAARAGIALNHIPYRGAAQVTTDLMGGTIDMTVMQIGTCVPLVKNGSVRALAVTSLVRSPLLPDVPTLAESGMPGFDTYNWNGLMAPAGTPPAIVRKIAQTIGKALATNEAHDWFAAQSYVPSGEALGAFGTFLDSENDRWKTIIRSADIKEEATQ